MEGYGHNASLLFGWFGALRDSYHRERIGQRSPLSDRQFAHRKTRQKQAKASRRTNRKG